MALRSSRPLFSTFRASSSTALLGSHRQILCVVIVAQQTAAVVERFGKFQRILNSGLHFVLPGVDRIAYSHSLKEAAVEIHDQTAITNDNVYINVNGVLYVRIVDPVKASYGTAQLDVSMTSLAQTTMRSELGKITLDKTFAEREVLNANIVEQINRASDAWGINCLRYEIRDITPPASVKIAMDMQAEAERKKRAAILESEGKRQAAINHAQGQRQASVLAAKGDAKAMVTRAKAIARGIRVVAKSLQANGGKEAVALRIAEQYVTAWGQVAKKGTTVLLPSDTSNPANLVASALAIYQNVVNRSGLKSAGHTSDLPTLSAETLTEDNGNEAKIEADANIEDTGKIPQTKLDTTEFLKS